VNQYFSQKVKSKTLPPLCIVQEHGSMKLANINTQHWHHQRSNPLTNRW